MELPKQPYHIIEDFIDPEYCKSLTKFFMDNMGPDERDLYGFYGLGGINEFFIDDKPVFDFDPENKIYEAVHFAYKFFLDNYPVAGEFDLNRCHANYMLKGALLHSHRDDVHRYDVDVSKLDLPIKTHVCGIFLNDDYEGGELTFPELKIELKPKAGSLVLFPGYYTRHGVNEVKSGTRLNILAHFFDVVDKNKIPSEYLDTYK